MNKKLLLLSILSSLAVVFITSGVIFFTYRQLRYTDIQGVALGAFKNMEELNFPTGASVNLKQEIISTYNNLSRITMTVKSSQAVELSARLKESDKDVIVRQKNIQINPVSDFYQYINWDFEPIVNSQGKTYIIEIARPINGGGLVFYAVPPEKYDGGKLFIDNAENSNSRLIIDWQYYNAKPWGTMVQRLTYAKPGIFNKPLTFNILFALFAFSEFILLYFLFYFFLEEKLNHGHDNE